jgi:hypothetical protein
MKKVTLTFLFFLTIIITYAQVQVKGYYKANGTYVQPYTRSSPDKDPTNNYSYPGNTNPYTGKVATGNPDTYLKNYPNYNPSGSSNLTNYNSTGTYNSITTYPTTYPNNSSYNNTYATSSSNPTTTNYGTSMPSTVTLNNINSDPFKYSKQDKYAYDVLMAEKKYLKDNKGNYTGDYLKLSEEDEVMKKYGLYDINSFPKGTLVVYSNGQRLLFDNFGNLIANKLIRFTMFKKENRIKRIRLIIQGNHN